MVALGGVCGFIWGACVVLFRGACVVLFEGGMHGFIRGGMHGFIQRGVCMVLFSGGHAWFYSVGGGVRGFFSFFGYIDTVNERAVRILLECILG